MGVFVGDGISGFQEQRQIRWCCKAICMVLNVPGEREKEREKKRKKEE